MKDYRAKQQQKENNEDEENNDDDNNISTTSSNNDNKMRNEDNIIHCDCGSYFHKSYKTRHLKSKVHIEGLKKKEEVKTIELKIKN